MSIVYKPEIDGLRTVAVISVIIYHAEFMLGGSKLLPGGFLGVDIFFVISGYLISSILLTEFNKTGTISIREFYKRRARRLLPVLSVILLLTMPFAWYLLLPEQLLDYCKSLIASITFSSNIYWNFSLQQYGAESALLKPLLHTWSLGVEEQFYILYPLLLLMIYKRFKPETIPILLIMALISLQFSEWLTKTDQFFSFYMIPSRFWELLAGGILAHAMHYYPPSNREMFLQKTMPILGINLILYSIVFFKYTEVNHPGFITSLPVLGTILVIRFSGDGNIVTKLLSHKLIVGIGLISYSLYLWHYPLFAFARIASDDLSFLIKIGLICATFILSIASYFLIELPFRRKIRFRNTLVYTGSSITILLVLSIGAILKDGFPERLGFSPDLASSFNGPDLNKVCGVISEDELISSGLCEIGSFNEDPSFVVFGDSHALSLLNLYDELGTGSERNGRFTFMSGCPPLLGVYPNNGGESKRLLCFQQSKKVLDFVRDNPVKFVYLVARWDYYVNPRSLRPISKEISPTDWNVEESKKVLEEQILVTIQEFTKAGATPVVLLQIPHQNKNPKGVYQQILDEWKSEPKQISEKLEDWIYRLSLTREEHQSRQETANSIIRNAIEGSKAIIIDPLDVYCTEKCLIGSIWGSYYQDVDHLSLIGAEKLKNKLKDYFE